MRRSLINSLKKTRATNQLLQPLLSKKDQINKKLFKIFSSLIKVILLHSVVPNPYTLLGLKSPILLDLKNTFFYIPLYLDSLCLPLKIPLTCHNSEIANLWSFWNNIWSWVPWTLLLSGPPFVLLLVLLFGPCIINALSRFISQQVQWIKFQLLVKEYSLLPMHEPSVQFYRGFWRLHGSTPETSTYLLLPHCQQEVDRHVITPLPNSSWVLASKGKLVGWAWEPKGQMSQSVSQPPWRAL
jgi:hypothetical protein